MRRTRRRFAVVEVGSGGDDSICSGIGGTGGGTEGVFESSSRFGASSFATGSGGGPSGDERATLGCEGSSSDGWGTNTISLQAAQRILRPAHVAGTVKLWPDGQRNRVFISLVRRESNWSEVIGQQSEWSPYTCREAGSLLSYEEREKREAVMDFESVVTRNKIDPPESFPEDRMILWDSEPRHNGGRVILLGNGEVMWLPEAAFQKRLEEQGQ